MDKQEKKEKLYYCAYNQSAHCFTWNVFDLDEIELKNAIKDIELHKGFWFISDNTKESERICVNYCASHSF
jgi:hypothetical protein